jgi:Na+-transporting NADH:ubiquinone oxidoreductase subunit B
MQRVLYALAPLVLQGVYLFGWRVLVLLAVVNAAAFFTEYLFTRQWRQPVTSAVFVTGTLFTLSLPPTLPYWMAVVGVVFAVAFGKMVYGGFGRNIFNPALTGRAFIYISFGNYMTSMWGEPIAGGSLPGGFGAYTCDAITQATPGMLLKVGHSVSLAGELIGATPGTIGGTGVALALLGGLYIIWKQAANYRIVAAGIAGFLLTQGALWLAGVKGAAAPFHAAMAGSFVIGMFFYATDPVSASQTDEGRWVYGAFIGAMSSLIGVFSAWPAGTMFAILMGNMLAPLIDMAVKELKQHRKQRAAARQAPAKAGT